MYVYDAVSVVSGHACVCLSVGMNVVCVCVRMFMMFMQSVVCMRV